MPGRLSRAAFAFGTIFTALAMLAIGVWLLDLREQRTGIYSRVDRHCAADGRCSVEADQRSAAMAEVSVDVGLLQLAISTLSLVAVIASLVYTARAARAAADSARYAGEEIARSEAGTQAATRAYMRATPGELGFTFGVGQPLRVPVTVENVGQTPAYAVVIGATVFGVRSDTDLGFLMDHPMEPLEGLNRMDFLPGERLVVFAEMDDGLSPAHVEGIASRVLLVVVRGFIQYRDAFGNAHQTMFAFTSHGGEDEGWVMVGRQNSIS